MKKNIEQTLLEMFGEPVETWGVKIGDVPGIKTRGVVGVPDAGDSWGRTCPDCGMMLTDEGCGCGEE